MHCGCCYCSGASVEGSRDLLHMMPFIVHLFYILYNHVVYTAHGKKNPYCFKGMLHILFAQAHKQEQGDVIKR